jgi:hypothetical protein
MNKTVASVIDDINEWENPRGGSVFYVTAIFTDESVGSVGRKDHDAALEVQGLLREAIGQEQDFVLEDKGKTQTGRDKFKILGFGTPGGAATYTAPGVQGGGTASASGGGAAPSRGRSPEQSDEDPRRSKEEMRRSEALRAAASFLSMTAVSTEKVLEVAGFFEEWLSDASSAYSNGSGTVTPVVEVQAGASEDSSGSEPTPRRQAPTGVGKPQEPDLSGGGVESKGKEPASPPHEHDWQPHPNLHGWLTCECGENRKKWGQ